MPNSIVKPNFSARNLEQGMAIQEVFFGGTKGKQLEIWSG